MIKSLNDIASVAAYLRRIGARARSLRTAVVEERRGDYWEDIAVISIDKSGAVKAPAEFAPTESEKSAIIAECEKILWPTLQPLPRLGELPEPLKDAKPEDIFEFRGLHDEIIMLQHRRELKGEKSYVPYTHWSDGEWRAMEPEGLLPLWGLDQLKNHTTVFIHEGAKAARKIRTMVEARTEHDRAALAAHPWGEELSAAAHLGWIGGALSPFRTDWSILARAGVKRAYIVSDNDAPGVAAVPAIATHLRFPTFHIQFTNEWPGGFDLADPFPKDMFKILEGVSYYVGPSFRSVLHPATWATDQVSNPKGKPTTYLRKNFKEMWSYVEEADLFVCIEMPEIIRSEPVMNKMLAAFSHTNATSNLLVRAYTGRSAKLCYRPDIKGRIVTDSTTSAINLHTPTHIKSVPGDFSPFLDFMTYMFPNADERQEALRWCATLIARPEIRMEYGLLLVSEKQGIGKEQPLDAKIFTPRGWRLMRDMQPGMEISTANFSIQKVTGVFPQGEKDVYQVEFFDGKIVECGIDHNWAISENFSRRQEDFRDVMTTKQIIESLEEGREQYIPPIYKQNERETKIVAIHKKGRKLQQCISVSSPDKLYITDGFKVTHNTTIGSSILAPLVGPQNVGYPTEAQIVQSEFNGWIANKRLCVVNEIYSGHSWKAYNKLKSAITDKEVEVNEKYQRTYTIENWCHIFACSNSPRALRVEEDDRRWFYPEVTEDKWPRYKFENLHNWLRSGGLSIIKYWAENFGDYVKKGQAAPMTERKRELIFASQSEGQQEAAELAQALNRKTQPIVLAMKDIIEWVRQSVQGRVYDTDMELRKAMKDAGMIWSDERFLIGGRVQHSGMNRAAYDQLQKDHGLKLVKNTLGFTRTSDDDPEEMKERRKRLNDAMRDMLKVPADAMDPSM